MLTNVGEDVASMLALISAADSAPLRRATMWVAAPPEDGMAGYRRLAASVLAQLAQDVLQAARTDVERTRRVLAQLSAQEDTFGVWCDCLNLDPEKWIDGLLRRLTTPGQLRLPNTHQFGAAAAAD